MMMVLLGCSLVKLLVIRDSRVRQALRALREKPDRKVLRVNRARKVQRFLSQPFAVAEQFTGVPGVMVSIEDTIRGFRLILDGEVDDIPEQAFLNVGTIEEAVRKGEEILAAIKG